MLTKPEIKNCLFCEALLGCPQCRQTSLSMASYGPELTFRVVQWLKTVLPVQRAWVQYLVREQRSNTQHGKKKKKNIKQKQETELHARNSRAASAGTGCDSMGLGEEVSHRGPHV